MPATRCQRPRSTSRTPTTKTSRAPAPRRRPRPMPRRSRSTRAPSRGRRSPRPPRRPCPSGPAAGSLAWRQAPPRGWSRCARRSGRPGRPRHFQSSPSTAPGVTAFTSTPASRERVREHPAERQLRGLRDRVGGVESARRAPARRRAHVHHAPAARVRHGGGQRAHQPHRRHHVQLPLLLPVGVGQVLERAGLARAGVVHERPGRLRAGLEHALAGIGGRHVELDVARRAGPR